MFKVHTTSDQAVDGTDSPKGNVGSRENFLIRVYKTMGFSTFRVVSV